MKRSSVFYERLVNEVEKRKKSINYIERELGYPRNALHNYKNGSGPSGSRLIEISQYLKISPLYLIGMSNDKNIDSPTIYFKQLSEVEKLDMLKIAQDWAYLKIKNH